MAPSRWQVEKHVVTFEEPDVLVMRIEGRVELEACKELTIILREQVARHGRIFVLTDLSNSEGFAPEARRYIGGSTALDLSAVVFFGGSFAVRTMMNMMLRAVALVRRGPEMLIRFLDTEQTARTWVAEARAAEAARRQKAAS